jgi:hypothetical protein
MDIRLGEGCGILSKVKLQWDQSKRIVTEDNTVDLERLIRMAIRPTEQASWIAFMVSYIKLIYLMHDSNTGLHRGGYTL